MKRVALMTSGGDAPGMNAAVRAIVRAALSKQMEPWGIYRAYNGMIDNNMQLMSHSSVSNIIQRGGTILKTSRSECFRTIEGIQQAVAHLEERGIDALVAVGGDGTIRGLLELQKYWSGKVIALPGTIDNDLYGTDETIGYDTAVNTAVEAIDKIRDTADAHERNFIVEVMGHHAGHIALSAGVAGGAEEILIPEVKTAIEHMCTNMQYFREQGKSSHILVVAEGDAVGIGFKIAKKLQEMCGVEYKVTVLGHVQRGGSPTAKDRLLASKLGGYAVDLLHTQVNGVMVGEVKGELVHTPLQETVTTKKEYDHFLYELSKVLR